MVNARCKPVGQADPYLAAAAAIAARHSIKKKTPAPPKGRSDSSATTRQWIKSTIPPAGKVREKARRRSYSGKSGARAAIGGDGGSSAARSASRSSRRHGGWRRPNIKKKSPAEIGTRLARAREGEKKGLKGGRYSRREHATPGRQSVQSLWTSDPR